MKLIFWNKEIDIIFMYVPSVTSFLCRCFSAFVTGNRVRYASSYSSFSLCALVNICCACDPSVISVGMSKTSSFKSCIIFELKSENNFLLFNQYSLKLKGNTCFKVRFRTRSICLRFRSAFESPSS